MLCLTHTCSCSLTHELLQYHHRTHGEHPDRRITHCSVSVPFSLLSSPRHPCCTIRNNNARSLTGPSPSHPIPCCKPSHSARPDAPSSAPASCLVHVHSSPVQSSPYPRSLPSPLSLLHFFPRRPPHRNKQLPTRGDQQESAAGVGAGLFSTSCRALSAPHFGEHQRAQGRNGRTGLYM
jgi:hypothetical protein